MTVRLVACTSASSPSRLPGLDRALNPYRGCEHSCAYCYAQDVTRFEMGEPWGSCIEVKTNIISKLKKELMRGARGVYGLGTVTDPYQPLEEKHELTRGCLLILKEAGATVSILTKSDLVLRDLDILSGWKRVEVGVSVSLADDSVASILEPNAPSPTRRFEAIRALVDSDIPTYLMAAPIIKGVGDSPYALSRLVESAANAGVRRLTWDKYNPKPLAANRLGLVMTSKGLTFSTHSPMEASEVRSVLLKECNGREIELVDAF